MIKTEEEDTAGSSSNKEEAMEQEDGEVSDASCCDVANDEGEIIDEEADKSLRREVAAPAKSDANYSKKTALEKLKNMSFSSRSKLPVRSPPVERKERERKERQTASKTSSTTLLHSPSTGKDKEGERRQRKRRWEERTDEQERHQQVRNEERPRPLREAVAANLPTALPVMSRPAEPARPTDQPHTLRQRVEKLTTVQDSEVINMSENELRSLIARMCDLSKEQQRLLRGRQTQFNTLREMYVEVKGDIEKLYMRVPVHLRMDLPPPPQAFHPSTLSTSGSALINGEPAGHHLEQRLRLPSLFDPVLVGKGANGGLSPGNGHDISLRSEGRRSRAAGLSEAMNSSSDSQKALGGRNGIFYSGGPFERGMHEEIGRVRMESGDNLRSNDRSNHTDTVVSTPHTGINSSLTVHSANSKRPLFSGLSGPGHLDHAGAISPSTSMCDPVSKPLFSRRDLGENSARLSGSRPHGASSKGATDSTSLVGNFSDTQASLINFANSANPRQAAHAVGQRKFDIVDKSITSTYAAVQTNNTLNALEPGENDGVRVSNQVAVVHSGAQAQNSFVHPTKSLSPRAVNSLADTDSALCNTYHDDLIYPQHGSFKSDELSSSQPSLPNLSEPPPPFGSVPVNTAVMLPNAVHGSNVMPPAAVAAPGAVPAPYCSVHSSVSLQPVSSTAVSNTLSGLPANSSMSQKLQPQPGNVAAAPSLLPLQSGATTVNVPLPDFSVPPPVALPLTARTSVGTPAVATGLISHCEATSSTDTVARPSSDPPVQGSLSDFKGGVLPNNTVLTGLPSMNVPPPSFSVPPPRAPNAGPPFSSPPPATPGGAVSGPRPVNLTPSMATAPPNLVSGHVGLNCPPPDMSQPPPNIRNQLSGNNAESVQQMVSAMMNQSSLSGQKPVDVVTELLASAYNRAGGIRLHHESFLKQRMSLAMDNSAIINKMRAPAPVGPPRPLSSIGKLSSVLMLPSGTRCGPAARNSNFNKQKVSQNRSSTNRSQQPRQKRQISDIVAIIPDEYDHPSSREEPNDSVFLDNV